MTLFHEINFYNYLEFRHLSKNHFFSNSISYQISINKSVATQSQKKLKKFRRNNFNLFSSLEQSQHDEYISFIQNEIKTWNLSIKLFQPFLKIRETSTHSMTPCSIFDVSMSFHWNFGYLMIFLQYSYSDESLLTYFFIIPINSFIFIRGKSLPCVF